MNPDLLPPGENRQTVSATSFITAPLPLIKADVSKHYTCTLSHASMFRPDGKKLPFVHGHLETDLIHDQNYLDTEIASGNQYIRPASEEEIFASKMRRDPRSTLKDSMRRELEDEIRAKLEAEIRAKMLAGGVDTNDAAKLSGTDALRAKLELLKAGGSVRTDTATVIMQSTAAPLRGIVGTDSIKEGAASGVAGE